MRGRLAVDSFIAEASETITFTAQETLDRGLGHRVIIAHLAVGDDVAGVKAGGVGVVGGGKGRG